MSSKKTFLLVLLFATPQFLSAMNPGSRSAAAQEAKEESYFGVPQKELEDVFESAPARAQRIVKHLKNPLYFADPNRRSAFFIGVPGTGKTTMAKAIAYKAGWDCISRDSSSFAGAHRRATAVALNSYFKEVQDILDAKDENGRPEENKIVVVIDGVNELLDRTHSKHHDTDTTSKALIAFIDGQRGNERFFFIGTMNDCTKIPEQVKSRMLGKLIEFTVAQSNSAREKILRSKLLNHSTQFLPECDANFLHAFLQKCNNWSGREFEQFSFMAIRIFRVEEEIMRAPGAADEHSSLIQIGQRHLEGAYHEIENIKKFCKLGHQEETPEEQSERHFVQQQRNHVEQQAMSERHHKEQQATIKRQFYISQATAKIHFNMQQESQKDQFDSQQKLAKEHYRGLQIFQKAQFDAQQALSARQFAQQQTAHLWMPR